jgi:hypothetical protein
LGCGLALSTDLEGDSTWNIGVSLLKTALNRRAGELRLAAQIGESPLVLAERPYRRWSPAPAVRSSATPIGEKSISCSTRRRRRDWPKHVFTG